jgi:plasmid stability protein
MMARLVIDLDDALYEVLVALAREHHCSVEEEISSLLAEAGWREQAGMEAARRPAEHADEDTPAPGT